MARKQSPEATPQEINDLVSFLSDQAKEQGSRRIFVSHEDIEPHLFEKENINRIRHILANQLKTRGVRAIFTSKNGVKGYQFELAEHYEVGKSEKDSVPSTPSVVKKNRPQTKTLTAFQTKYVIPDLFGDVRLAIEHNRRPLIIGPPGCGKSRMYEEIGATLGFDCIRRPLSQVADPAELTGYLHIVEENGASVTKFVDGTITMCARLGKMLILDEFDNASPAANEALKQITEDGGNIVVETEKGTEIVETHPDFRICFTANTDCRGDSTGLFPNAESQNRATLDRIRPKFHMDYQYAVERSVIIDMGIPEAVVDALYRESGDKTQKGLVYLIREAIQENRLTEYLGFRSIIGFAQDFEIYGWNKSFLYNVIHDFDEDFQQTVMGIVKSRLGSWAEPTRDAKKLKEGQRERETKGFVLASA